MKMITGAVIILAGVIAICFSNLHLPTQGGGTIRACDHFVVIPLGWILLMVGIVILLWGMAMEGFAQK